jgi:hypothetical protein
VVVRALGFGKTYKGQAKKAGFEVTNFTLANPRNLASIEQPLEMVSSGPSRVGAKPARVPEAKPAAKAAQPGSGANSPDAKASAKVVRGRLVCTSNPVGAEVLIDGKPTGRKTPVPKSQSLELPLGAHRIVFRFEGKSSAPTDFTITEAHTEDAPFVLKGEL